MRSQGIASDLRQRAHRVVACARHGLRLCESRRCLRAGGRARRGGRRSTRRARNSAGTPRHTRWPRVVVRGGGRGRRPSLTPRSSALSSASIAGGRTAVAAAPTAAYWSRRSSCALADQGMISASRQIQSVANSSHQPAVRDRRLEADEHFGFERAVVEEAASGARVADTDFAVRGAECPSCGGLVATDDEDRP